MIKEINRGHRFTQIYQQIPTHFRRQGRPSHWQRLAVSAFDVEGKKLGRPLAFYNMKEKMVFDLIC
jgi:hypothetical protein